MAERGDRVDAVKRALIGRPRSGAEMGDTLLSKILALPIFSADPLSSVAYATEAALVVLISASASAGASRPADLDRNRRRARDRRALVHADVQAYETSGGAYVVAKENLGTLPSLVAAAALLVDYVLTVAVSVAAGVLAITSAAPSLSRPQGRRSRSLLILLLTLVNLRGVRESGFAFALPTYSFVARDVRDDRDRASPSAPTGSCPQAHVPDPIAAGTGRQRRRLRRAACLRLGRGRADRRRVDLERRQRLQAAAGPERRARRSC